MKIDLSFNAGQFDELQLREKNVIVLDVLRASSTITVALNNGAREIMEKPLRDLTLGIHRWNTAKRQ
jgi:phosphosulfolactate phosphohydrolase-like enzyme